MSVMFLLRKPLVWLTVIVGGLVFAGFRPQTPGTPLSDAVASLLLSGLPSADATPSTPWAVISDGEELVYEVSWWTFKLGQIRVKTSLSKTPDGKVHPSAIAFIDSYGNLPFVDIHAVSTSEMDSALVCRAATSVEKRKEEWWVLKHYYDPEAKRLIIEDTWQKEKNSPPYKPPEYDTLSVSGTLVDGVSIFYFARKNLHTQKTIRVNTIVYKKLGQTTIQFEGEKSSSEIEALEQPIAVKRVHGTAEFEGIFGLSGDFEGWFSNDSAAVPIKAKLGVIIGSINIELIQWKRNGWAPPQAES